MIISSEGGLEHRLLFPHLFESERCGEELLEGQERSQCQAHEGIIRVQEETR